MRNCYTNTLIELEKLRKNTLIPHGKKNYTLEGFIYNLLMCIWVRI